MFPLDRGTEAVATGHIHMATQASAYPLKALDEPRSLVHAWQACDSARARQTTRNASDAQNAARGSNSWASYERTRAIGVPVSMGLLSPSTRLIQAAPPP